MVSRPRRLSSTAPVRSVSPSGPPRRRGRPGYDVGSLVDKAVEVFTVKGFDGTSMEDLSRGLGISKSAIYHHVTRLFVTRSNGVMTFYMRTRKFYTRVSVCSWAALHSKLPKRCATQMASLIFWKVLHHW